MTQRPTPVTVIVILIFLSGLILLAASVSILTITDSMWEEILKILEDAGIPTDGLTLSFLKSIGLIVLALCAFTLLIGFALWKGWTIAWYLAVILFILGIGFSLLAVIGGAFFSIVAAGIVALLLYYLFRPDVKEFFKV